MEIRTVEGITFVKVPGGEFHAGLEEPVRLFEGVYRRERPRSLVSIAPFWMSVYTITNAQFERWMPRHSRSVSSPEDDSPVVDVTWYEADAFCRHYNFRLPTEDQWERAAGGPKNLKFSYGNEADPAKANVFPVHRRAVAVSAYLPNEFGLYQLSGNVYELTSDLIKVGDEYVAITKGGSWGNCSLASLVATRKYEDVVSRSSRVGFRVCLTQP